MMKALIENIARALVDDPEAVKVREVEGDQATVLELTVAADDLGKVIGRQGRTVRAMRTLLGAASIRAGKRVMLEIME
ncbi:KH domain-containing protein [Desulfovibrio sp.]|uniref:KH domain-containing protein n=1 Tax=Desulfovibrio sp. TaxID=885 RepID=UPI0023C13D40|nr:KH domain-containing protein [Desulfovibrio sp.]MDE7242111.1 KH domain-containing protein [Desulfovibrio sp.]